MTLPPLEDFSLRDSMNYAQNGDRCPRCVSTNICKMGDLDQVSDTDLHQKIVCMDCKLKFTEVYTLTGINELIPK